MVPNVVIQNYPDLSKKMKSGHKKQFFGKSYVIRNHFWVNFGPKRTKIDPIFVHFGSYWMLISMVKMILVIFLHEDGHRNQMMAISCLKTSFLGSENQFFHTFDFFLRQNYKFFFVAWTTNMVTKNLSPKKSKHCVLSPWARADVRFLGRWA